MNHTDTPAAGTPPPASPGANLMIRQPAPEPSAETAPESKGPTRTVHTIDTGNGPPHTFTREDF